MRPGPARGWRWAAAVVALAGLIAAGGAGADDGFRDASQPWTFRFPADHAAHPAFRTEWWYYTGHLAAGERRYGFELTFFRVGLARSTAERRSAWAIQDLVFAHAALTDESARRFRFADTLARPSLGRAGADSTRYHVWVDDWSARLADDGTTHRLRADAPDFGLDLALVPAMPPVVHGRDGVSRKGADPAMSSHYYSIPRLAARGRIRTDGAWREVSGQAWMDHEFMTTPEAGVGRGWDWFSVQLDDGRALMLYQLRLPDGGIEPRSSGTWIDADGASRHLAREAFTIEATGSWTSPASGARYPSGWRLRVPSAALDLTLEPVLADQELRTRGAAGVTYWEGSVRVRGTRAGRPATGLGYVELTGYAGRPPGR